MIFNIWDGGYLKTEWRNLLDYIKTIHPECRIHFEKIKWINKELEPYHAIYIFERGEIEFETEQDFMFFKLRFA